MHRQKLMKCVRFIEGLPRLLPTSQNSFYFKMQFTLTKKNKIKFRLEKDHFLKSIHLQFSDCENRKRIFKTRLRQHTHHGKEKDQ